MILLGNGKVCYHGAIASATTPTPFLSLSLDG